MALELNGTTGVSLVQDGVVTAADLASGAITSDALPAGSVLQVVQSTSTPFDTTTSTSFVDTSLSGTITPTSASSTILVCITSNIGASTNSGSTVIAINRGATKIVETGGVYSGTGGIYVPFAHNFEDSPSTTSAVTYTVRFKTQDAASTAYFNVDYNAGTGETSTITLMEIAG